MIGIRRRRVGDVVTVHHCHGGYRLPNDLTGQSIVTVKSTDIGYALVAAGAGREWTVALSCIDMPDDIWWHGQWIDRQIHPDGAKALGYWNDHERAEREEGRWREYVI